MVSVDQVINISDPSVIWFRIPGFPGYEISNTNYIRSFKSRKKYPYGTLVKHDKNNYVIITNSNNQRIKLNFGDIWSRVNSEPHIKSHTWEVQGTSRNQMACVDTEAESEIGTIVGKPKVRNSKEHEFVDFSNIPDIDLNKFI